MGAGLTAATDNCDAIGSEGLPDLRQTVARPQDLLDENEARSRRAAIGDDRYIGDELSPQPSRGC